MIMIKYKIVKAINYGVRHVENHKNKIGNNKRARKECEIQKSSFNCKCKHYRISNPIMFAQYCQRNTKNKMHAQMFIISLCKRNGMEDVGMEKQIDIIFEKYDSNDRLEVGCRFKDNNHEMEIEMELWKTIDYL